MQKAISRKDILRQLKADLIGKDSYRGVTLTYSWLANQFGHFSLGFVPSLLLYSQLNKHLPAEVAAFRAALYVSLAWFAFELYNFLGPLLLNHNSATKMVFVKGSRYVFSPAWKNVAFDTLTDLFFFWFGAFSAALFLSASLIAGIILCGLFLLLLYPAAYWFLTKMYLQNAQYPFQFRLSQWSGIICAEDKKTVNDFVKGGAGKHLFIFGGRRSGKTALGVGIATEFSIGHRPCMYSTGMKLYHLFSEADDIILADEKELWSWRKAGALVIDDINPGDPIKENLISPHQFLTWLNVAAGTGTGNTDILKEKSVVWIMGNDNEADDALSWKKMLYGIGVKPENVISINLHCNITDE